MSFTVKVTDLSCEESNPLSTPQISLVTSSVTTVATLYGYSEFIASSPPKKYKKATWSGSSKRVAFTAEKSPRQCAGAKYEFSGVGEYDSLGNQISSYTKNFYAECAKQFWPVEGPQELPGAINTSVIAAEVVGFCWSDMPDSCGSCDHTEANWTFLGNKAINSPVVDFQGFYALAADVVTTATSASVNVVHTNITSILTDQPYSWVLFGTDADNYAVNVGATVYDGRVVITTPPTLIFPAVGLSVPGEEAFHVAHYVIYTDTSNQSVVLSDEYTDAEALANATITHGTSRIAQNFPRTTGFTSLWTTVNYDLDCINLIVGASYKATINLLDSDGTESHIDYVFTAAASTHTINNNLDPAVGHSLQIKSIAIQFN